MDASSHNLLTLGQLNVGDLVEFPRGAYSHWAVYIGNGKVIHLAGEDNDGIDAEIKAEHLFTICGKRFSKAKVCEDFFMDVTCGCKARKNNDRDKHWTPLHPQEILTAARSRLGEVGYSLIYSNCEHFAKWCRYGQERSDQVDNVVTGAALAVASGLVLGVVHAIAKYWNSEEKEDDEKEKRQEL